MSFTELEEILKAFRTEWGVLGQIGVVLIVTFILDLVWRRLNHRLRDHAQRTTNIWDDALVYSLQKPLIYLIWLLGLSFSLELLQLQAALPVLQAVPTLRTVLVVALLAWFVGRVINQVEANYLNYCAQQQKEADKTTLDALAKLGKAITIVISLLIILQTLGFSISGVLAFGGIGGIAVGFAAKDLLANFFGGLMIYLDRPFKVGDWVRSPDQEIEGKVEKIGWRLTTIRRFDKRPIYVPNSAFTHITVENPSRMTHRRIYETIGIRYDDANRMAAIVQQVKTMLQQHPDIDATQTLIANFNAYGPSSLDFFVYTFTKTTDWITYHEVKQDVLFKIYGIIDAAGAEVAFPTSTLHVPALEKQDNNGGKEMKMASVNPITSTPDGD